MKSITVRILSIVTVLAIMITSISPTIAGATTLDEEEQQVRELAEALEFMFEEAMIKDKTGKIVDIDVKKVREEFPPSPELDKFLAEIQQAKTNKPTKDSEEPKFTTMTDAYNACVADKLGDWAGDFIPTTLIAGVYQYLADGEYYNAAKKLVRAGVKGSIFGIAASLSWIVVECTWEQDNY